MKKTSNRGGALLSVIIVMSVVGILSTLILSIAYMNFTMKNVDRKSKNNFYSAESVVEEICAGLQKEVSLQYKNAYTEIMENYGSYDSADEMRGDFNTVFVLNMVDELKMGSDAESYNVAKLETYVSVANYTSDAEAKPYTVTTEDGQNILDTLEDGLCIRNLKVTYQDGGYVDTIQTDIKIATPDMAFSLISTMPEVADYSFIAQGGLELTGGAAWNLEGKAFAGIETDASGNVEPSVTLNASSTLDISNEASTLFVSEGEVEVIGGSSLTTGVTTSLWAESLTAKRSVAATGDRANNTLTLKGRTYIKDDTTLDGVGNTVKLGGQYYGYSNNDADASESSAIVVNGTDTTLDMSELDTLVIAGTAFVGTKGETNDAGTTSEDILMGDSIAVKGNQLAYLVPAECRGIGVNPMSYSQYEKLVKDEHWQTTALSTNLSSIRRSIASYGSVKITPVFTQKSGGAVYLYLDFSDSNVASQYFMDYYEASNTEVDAGKYLDRYLSTFKFNTSGSGSGMSRLVTQGNYLVPATYSEGTYKPVYKENTSDIATTAQELVNYSSSYKALCRKLVENMSSLTSEELSASVYSNLIHADEIKEFFEANRSTHSANVEFDTANGFDVATIVPESGAADSEIKAIIVDNAGKAAYNAPVGGSGIILATGDVNIGTGSLIGWNGLVVCKGRLTVNGGSVTNPCTLRGNADATSKAMQLVCSVGAPSLEEGDATTNFAVLNFFKGGANFTLGSSADEQGGRVDVRECLSYENWMSE